MTAPRVLAVVAAPAGAELDGAALAGVVTGPGALTRAVATDAEWLWLLAAGARPAQDALARLLDAVAPAGEPPAALVAGMVLDEAGRPLEALLPAPDRSDPAAVLRLAALRLCPVRHAPFANALVRRDAFARLGLPDERTYGPYAPSQWTARLLRDEPGRLCPASVVTVDTDAQPRATLAATVRMARSGVWTRGEALGALGALSRPRARRAAGRW